MKKYLALLKFAVSQTPVNAMTVLKALNIQNWDFSLDGTAIKGYKLSFKTVESLRQKVLVVEIVHGNTVILAESRLSSEGDKLTINGEPMLHADFDLDVIGWTDTVVQVELRFTDPATGQAHEYKLANNKINPFF